MRGGGTKGKLEGRGVCLCAAGAVRQWGIGVLLGNAGGTGKEGELGGFWLGRHLRGFFFLFFL